MRLQSSLALDSPSLSILTDAGLDRYDLATGQVSSLGNIGAGGARCPALALLPTDYIFSGYANGAYASYVLAR